jgi:hypothetical protein
MQRSEELRPCAPHFAAVVRWTFFISLISVIAIARVPLQRVLSVYDSPLRFQTRGEHADDSTRRESLSCEPLEPNHWVENETWMGDSE